MSCRGGTLSRGCPRGHRVSRGQREYFSRIPLRHNASRRHCVSRPAHEYLSEFLNDDGHFQPHCVSRGSPVECAQRIDRCRPVGPLRPLRHQPPPQAVVPVVVRIAPPPSLARLAVPLSLARWVGAGALTRSRSGVRLEPALADAARLATGHLPSRSRGGSGEGQGWISRETAPRSGVGQGRSPERRRRDQGWITSREQGWVTSR